MSARLLTEATERRLSDQTPCQTELVQDLLLRDWKPERLTDAGYRAYRQFGEDGVVQHPIPNVPIKNDLLIELGIVAEALDPHLLNRGRWELGPRLAEAATRADLGFPETNPRALAIKRAVHPTVLSDGPQGSVSRLLDDHKAVVQGNVGL